MIVIHSYDDAGIIASRMHSWNESRVENDVSYLFNSVYSLQVYDSIFSYSKSTIVM